MTLSCSSCHTTHNRAGQRYCKRCHAQAQKKYRSRLKRERKAVASFLRRITGHKFEQRSVA